MATSDLPDAREAEECVLGCILLDEACGWSVRMTLEPTDFFSPIHRAVYDAALSVLDAGKPPDLVHVVPVVCAAVKSMPSQDVAGACVGFMEAVPNSKRAVHYAEIVAQTARKRRMMQAAESGRDMLAKDPGTSTDLVGKVARMWATAAAPGKGNQLIEPSSLLAEFQEHRQRTKTEATGRSLGYPELDELGVLLAPGSLNVIGARPSMGKSSFTNSFIGHLALTKKVPVLFFSLEVPRLKFIENVLCAHSMTPHDSIRLGGSDLLASEEAYAQSKLIVDENADITADDMRALIRVSVGVHGTEVVAVDYLQLLRRSKGSQNREQEVAQQVATLKIAARENNVALVLLSQLNREVDKRETKIDGRKYRGVPRMSDLRESGAIEQDADIIMLLYRASYYFDQANSDSSHPDETDVIVAKNRNGKTGRAKLMFTANATSFRSALDLRGTHTAFDRRPATSQAGSGWPQQQSKPDLDW